MSTQEMKRRNQVFMDTYVKWRTNIRRVTIIILSLMGVVSSSTLLAGDQIDHSVGIGAGYGNCFGGLGAVEFSMRNIGGVVGIGHFPGGSATTSTGSACKPKDKVFYSAGLRVYPWPSLTRFHPYGSLLYGKFGLEGTCYSVPDYGEFIEESILSIPALVARTKIGLNETINTIVDFGIFSFIEKSEYFKNNLLPAFDIGLSFEF